MALVLSLNATPPSMEEVDLLEESNWKKKRYVGDVYGQGSWTSKTYRVHYWGKEMFRLTRRKKSKLTRWSQRRKVMPIVVRVTLDYSCQKR